MDLNDLKAFVLVAKEGSISRAAEQLNFVQSNITNKIKKLENHFDATLFYRHQQGVTLTSTGKELLRYSERIIQLFSEAENAIKYSTVPSGSISIGSMETTAAIRLPSILAQYSTNYPQVEIILETGPTEILLKKVRNYELEGAFIAEYPLSSELRGDLFMEEELTLVSSKPVNLFDLGKSNLLVFRKGCSYRRILEEWLKFEGIVPHRIMEFGSLEAILGCVQAGLGVSLLPLSVIKKFNVNNLHNINSIPIPEPYCKIKTMFIYRDPITNSSKAFREFINIIKRE